MPSSPPLKRARKTRAPAPHSIVDLIGGSSRAETALGEHAPEDAWTSLANTIDALGTASLPAREAAPVLVAPATGIPSDRTLKAEIRVSSPRPLAWARLRGQGEEYAALAAYVARRTPEGPAVGSDAADCPGQRLTDARRKFYAGLLHFRHPNDPDALAGRWQASLASRRDEGPAKSRLYRWQTSLQSLFYGYKHAHVTEFYVILASTVVLFTRTEGNGPVVWFSRATAGVRSVLSEHCVDFRVHRYADDPCVVVDGEVPVQAAYNFVFAAGPRLSGSTDVPMLIADVPFRGGSLVAAEVSDVAEANIIGEERAQFSLVITGLMLPRQIRDIAEALRVTQDERFSAVIETEKRGERLNLCSLPAQNSVSNGSRHKDRESDGCVIKKISMNGGSDLLSLTRDVD